MLTFAANNIPSKTVTKLIEDFIFTTGCYSFSQMELEDRVNFLTRYIPYLLKNDPQYLHELLLCGSVIEEEETGLDALFVNVLTGGARPEHLFQLMVENLMETAADHLDDYYEVVAEDIRMEQGDNHIKLVQWR